MHLRSLEFQGKLSSMLINIRDPSSLEEKVEPKSSISSGLRHHNMYPSWINLNHAGPFPKTLSKFLKVKCTQYIQSKISPAKLGAIKVLLQPNFRIRTVKRSGNNKKRSHTQLDSRKQVIAFQDRVMTINIKEAQHPLKREKQVIDKSSIMLKISTKSMHRVLV